MYQPSANVDFDFDGDGKTDISRWHSSTTEWRVKNSTGGSITNLTIGSSTSVIVPGDFDGDDITDRAVFSAGTWTVKQSSNGSTITMNWGTTGDKPVPADYDGDDITDFAIYRPSTNAWWLYYSSNGSWVAPTLGSSGDILVPADYDGDGKADIAVYRPSNGYWYVTKSGGGSINYNWGLSTDVPVPADYDYDGKTDLAVYRPSSGQWWILKSSNGSFIAPEWGNYEDQPVPGDYDGDHKADQAVWRPASGTWYILRSSDSGSEMHVMGQGGDVPVPSAYTKQIGSLAFSYDLAKARLSPKNATGGTNLYSRNFSWGTGLVGLPGRTGLDAGMGISYNSLVWTKQDSNIFFDTDYSNVSPGFRIGFATIDPVYYDSTTGKYNYLMVTPSGARVEFRQIGASNVYETADSSYRQLTTSGATNPNDAVENITITVKGTDGSQTTYVWKAGAFHCSQIKDRNGNYITIAHDDYGLLTSVTDTLERVITVNYDSEGYPTTITQTWKADNGSGSNVTHTYATFSYTTKTVSTNFTESPTIYGPPNGAVLKVLDKVTYADQASYTKFDYNGYVQVSKIRNYAADNHLLNSVTTNLHSPESSYADCPRLSLTKSWAQNFNGDTNGAEADGEMVIVHNDFDGNNTTDSMPDSLTGTKAKVTVYLENHPDGLISNTYYRTSGWDEGLPIATEDCLSNCTGSNRKRWTSTYWTQDNVGVSYILNPRVTETKVGDGTNTKRTTIGYYHTTLPVTYPYGLVNEVKQYDFDQTTVLKKATTEYNLSTTYTSRRIIGLPSEVKLFDGSDNLMSKVTYGYDEENFSQESNQNISSVIQHDNTNYSSSFIGGRGNQTSATRWDVINNTGITSKLRYDIAGSVVAKIDPLERKIVINYSDVFNDTTTTRYTYAYPTTLTDPASNSSTVKYRYDTGANVEATSPPPASQTHGKTTKRWFDSLGRIETQSVYVNTTKKSYVRNQYFDSGIQSKVFGTLVDGDNDGNVDEDEVLLSESWTDGAGRVRQARSPHTFDSGGDIATWSAVKTEYNILGQAWRASVPTEVDSSWAPAGDDYARGFIWNSRQFDWKGRVTKTVPTDSTGSDGKESLISYEGCGCAGGQVTTIQGPVTTAYDAGGTLRTTKRRTQKTYDDILGRTFKTELWDLNGEGSAPYATTVNTFNARDQVTQSIDYAGAAGSSTHQDTTVTFDGHGRLKTKHIPQQDTSAVTTYNYNDDDSILSVVDARGASTHYEYNSRGMVEELSWTVPSLSTIPVPDDITFAYDAIGNRTSMTDGLGNVAYEYDSLSRLTAETRQFNDTLANAPLSSNRFKLEYTYTPNGQLRSLKDPYGKQINYDFDKVGRLYSVTGAASYGGISTYASSPGYRAWGGLKHLDYGNGTSIDTTFNNRLQADHFEYNKSGQTAPLMEKNYQYYADGKLKFVQDLSVENSIWDRLMKYDHAGRVVEGRSSGEASGGTVANWDVSLPYRQSYAYDAFDNLTERNNLHWGEGELNGQNFNLSYTFQNNRATNNTHDADGRVTQSYAPDEPQSTVYDAGGQITRIYNGTDSDIYRYQAGDGHEAKRTTSHCVLNPLHPTDPCGWNTSTEYYIRSTALGGEVISDVGSDGKKVRTYVHAAGETIAWQNLSGTTESVVFKQTDASGLSSKSAAADGTLFTGDGYEGAPTESDPMGGNVGQISPYEDPIQPDPCPGCGLLGGGGEPNRVNGQSVEYQIDGVTVPNATFRARLSLAGGGSVDYALAVLSSRMSVVGVRNVGVSWGTPFVATYGLDGRGIITWGEYDPSMSDVNYGNETIIYEINWALDRFAFAESSRPLPKDKEKEKMLADAVQRVRDILNGDNDCAKFFKNKDNALKALNAFENKAEIGVVDSLGNKNTGIKQDEDKKNPVLPYNADGTLFDIAKQPKSTAAYRVFGRVRVNLYGPFFDKFSQFKVSGYDSGYARSQVLQILHELAHVVLDKGRPLIDDDGENGSTSESNSDILKAACQTEIEASGKR